MSYIYENWQVPAEKYFKKLKKRQNFEFLFLRAIFFLQSSFKNQKNSI